MAEAEPVVPEQPIRSLSITPVGEFSASQWANCGECSAICCSKGTIMDLLPEEAAYLEEAGTVLTALGEISRSRWSRKPKKIRFKLENDCGNLIRTESGAGVCTAFEDTERPEICSNFKAGDYYCMEGRLKAGEIDLKEFHNFDEATRS